MDRWIDREKKGEEVSTLRQMIYSNHDSMRRICRFAFRKYVHQSHMYNWMSTGLDVDVN